MLFQAGHALPWLGLRAWRDGCWAMPFDRGLRARAAADRSRVATDAIVDAQSRQLGCGDGRARGGPRSSSPRRSRRRGFFLASSLHTLPQLPTTGGRRTCSRAASLTLSATDAGPSACSSVGLSRPSAATILLPRADRTAPDSSACYFHPASFDAMNMGAGALWGGGVGVRWLARVTGIDAASVRLANPI
jgi:hypothetical protein